MQMAFLSSFLSCVKWVSTSLTPAAHLWPFLLLYMMEGIKAHCGSLSRIQLCRVEAQVCHFGWKAVFFFLLPVFQITSLRMLPSLLFTLQDLGDFSKISLLCFVLPSMDVAEMKTVFMYESHTLLSDCKLHSKAHFIAFKLKIYGLSNTAVTD